MKLLLLFNIIFITLFSIINCQNSNDIVNEGNDEFIDVSKAKINPYKDIIEKESFPPFIRCETLGTTFEMFFYNSTFMNCAPAQWTCEYDDLILLPNKTMAHCYNRRNFGVACLYGGFRPMSRCRHNYKKCGINYFNCKEKKPRKVVEYSDNFLYKLEEAVKSKNISIDEELLEKIKEAGDRRISSNITDIKDYEENVIEVDDDYLSKDDDMFDRNFTENIPTEMLYTTTTLITTSKLNKTLYNDISTPIIPVFDKTKDKNVSFNEFLNTTYSITTTLTSKNYLSNDIPLNNTTTDKKYNETLENINLLENNDIQQNISTQNSQIFTNIIKFYDNPIKNTVIIFLSIIIVIILIFICFKMCGSATYVYEVAEHQRLMDINVNSTTFKNETFNSNYYNRRTN
uniref:Chitin-binding type-2 domain-containing protein n=1 Tax=Strongyloides stercoralis TaxID=6248 RepID=A0A0K0EG79_STRER